MDYNYKTYSSNELAVILIDSFSGLEYKHKSAVLALYACPSEAFGNPEPAVKYLKANFGDSAANTFLRSFGGGEYTEFIVDLLTKKGITAVTYLSSDYPDCFDSIPLKPLCLYCKGDKSLLNAKNKISVVGSRKTLPFVLKKCESICSDLSAAGAVIVSGSAVGGDRSAILGGLNGGNGKVISVLAHGHDYVYPQSNRELIERVCESGLVVSEYPPDVQSAPWRFPMRNRVIAALGDACFIISGNMQSGTRYTAKFAEAYSRRLYAFPYSIGETSGEICNLLIKLNKASLVEDTEDIALCENITLNEDVSVELSDDEQAVFNAMEGECTVDGLCTATGKKSYEILPVLSMLEIKGLVARGKAAGSYVPLRANKERDL